MKQLTGNVHVPVEHWAGEKSGSGPDRNVPKVMQTLLSREKYQKLQSSLNHDMSKFGCCRIDSTFSPACKLVVTSNKGSYTVNEMFKNSGVESLSIFSVNIGK